MAYGQPNETPRHPGPKNTLPKNDDLNEIQVQKEEKKTTQQNNNSSIISIIKTDKNKKVVDILPNLSIDLRPEVFSQIQLFDEQIICTVSEEIKPAIKKILDNKEKFFDTEKKVTQADAIRLLISLGITLIKKL